MQRREGIGGETFVVSDKFAGVGGGADHGIQGAILGAQASPDAISGWPRGRDRSSKAAVNWVTAR